MARSLEPYRDRFLPDQFQRWLEIVRSRIGTVPCFVESTGTPEGVINGQKGDFFFDTVANLYYYKTTDTGNTGWAVLSVGVTPPGGADTEIQVNNAGTFAGITAGILGTVLTSNGVGVTPSYQAPATGVTATPTPVDGQIAIWTGANDLEGVVGFVTSGFGGSSPNVILGGAAAPSFRFPAFVVDYDTSDSGSFSFREAGATRGGLDYHASFGGFTDVLVLSNFVNGGADTNSVTLITADNTAQIICNEDGVFFPRGIQIQEFANPVHGADVAGRGQLWNDNAGVGGVLTWRNDLGTDFDLTLGAGAVQISGTPVANQVSVWTAADEIEGLADLTMDAALDRFQVGDGTIGTPGISLNSTASGEPFFRILRNGVPTVLMDFDNTNSSFDIDSDGDIRFRPGNTEVFELVDEGASLTIGGYRLVERADHSFTPAATFAEIWLANEVLQSLMVTTDDGDDAALNWTIAQDEFSLSGSSSVSVTGIPPWVTSIRIGFRDVSPSVSSRITIQLGDAGGLETTGYDGAVGRYNGTIRAHGAGFDIDAVNTSSAGIMDGLMHLERMGSGSNIWCMTGGTAFSSSATGTDFSGAKTLTATLDRVAIVASAGTFSAGSTWSVAYK